VRTIGDHVKEIGPVTVRVQMTRADEGRTIDGETMGKITVALQELADGFGRTLCDGHVTPPPAAHEDCHVCKLTSEPTPRERLIGAAMVSGVAAVPRGVEPVRGGVYPPSIGMRRRDQRERLQPCGGVGRPHDGRVEKEVWSMSNANALAIVEKRRDLEVGLNDMRDRLDALLPAGSHTTSARIVAIVLDATARDSSLLECTKGSILRAVAQSAEVGLEIASPLGHAYLVPFKNWKRNYRKAEVLVSCSSTKTPAEEWVEADVFLKERGGFNVLLARPCK
jgi:hypothetical protein